MSTEVRYTREDITTAVGNSPGGDIEDFLTKYGLDPHIGKVSDIFATQIADVALVEAARVYNEVRKSNPDAKAHPEEILREVLVEALAVGFLRGVAVGMDLAGSE